MHIRKRTISTFSTKSSKAPERPTTPPPNVPSIPNPSTTPRSVSSKASDKDKDMESLGHGSPKSLKNLGRKVSHSRPVRMLKSFGSFGSRMSLGNGRRASSSSIASMEQEGRMSGEESQGQVPLAEQAVVEDAPKDDAKGVHEEDMRHGPGPIVENEGRREDEVRAAELEDVVEDVRLKDADAADNEQAIEQPAVAGPESRNALELPDAADVENHRAVDADGEQQSRRGQHSLDHSISSTITAVEDDHQPAVPTVPDEKHAEVIHKDVDSKFGQAQDAVLVEEIPTNEEIKPYVVEIPNITLTKAESSTECEAGPAISAEATSKEAAPSPNPSPEAVVAPPTGPSTSSTSSSSKAPSVSEPRSPTPALDSHAPELHTPGISVASLFLPVPQVRLFATECARLSWWFAVAAAPSALLYIYHSRRTFWSRT